MEDLSILRNITLTPYILKAMALIRVQRICGGNQFRHSFATLGILLDYKYTDSVLLKSALLHDLFEDIGEEDLEEVRKIDTDGPAVVELILEVTRREDETKLEYMARQSYNSKRAKILKCADRISNLTDMHLDTHTEGKILSYLLQTETYVLPLATEVNNNFVIELTDLIKMRRKMFNKNTNALNLNNMYNYQTEKSKVFTESGQEMFLKIRDHVQLLLTQSGAVKMDNAISVVNGDSWLKVACVDRLVELKEIREVTTDDVKSQDRVFVKAY